MPKIKRRGASPSSPEPPGNCSQIANLLTSPTKITLAAKSIPRYRTKTVQHFRELFSLLATESSLAKIRLEPALTNCEVRSGRHSKKTDFSPRSEERRVGKEW